MNIRTNKFVRGFTLIELLVVLVILGLLAGMVGPNVMKYISSSKIEVAKAQLGDIAAGLDLFKLDVGRYPDTAEGLKVLVEAPDGMRGWNGPYLRKKKVPMDPWNRDYVYRLWRITMNSIPWELTGRQAEAVKIRISAHGNKF